MAFFDLRRILMEMLPSPAMMEQAEVLRIQTQLEEICRPLWAINAVIMDAELRTMVPKEQDLDDWVADVSATLVDLEDLLASIIDRRERAVESSRSFSRSSSVLLPTRFAFRVVILRKLRKMRCKLNGLVERGSAFNLQREPMDSMDPFQAGYSAILEDDAKGRGVEHEQIMELLQQQRQLQEVEMHSTMKDEEYSSDEIIEMDAPFIIQIRSGEGMGKRTLARMIYHDEWVCQHFHHRFWVDASNFYSYDVEGIGREIARSMGHGNHIEIPPQTSSFQDMWVFVNQQLAGRRYLLIFDGYDSFPVEVRNTELKWPDKWNELKRILLRVGGPGSAIIVTTATIYHDMLTEFNFRLWGISENDWTELFMRWALAYQGHGQNRHEKEEDIARTIAMQIYKRNYQRNRYAREDDPLSAKLMGSIFRYIEINRWQEIVNYSDLKEIADETYSNLIKLYFHPTRDAQSVFFRLLFPNDDDDNIFFSEEFMYLMTAEGLLPLWSDKDVRLGYMEIIKYKYQSWSKGIKTQYCFTINLDKDPLTVPKQCRHLYLFFSYNASTILAQFERNKLRTLILRCSTKDAILKDSKCQILTIPKRTFVALAYLHTLDLQATKIQHLPSTIGMLRDLRYLNLSYTEIHTLSKCLWNLKNLEILNLAHCQNLEKLSRQIHRLRRLRILKLAYCEKLQMLPTTITNLTNLQEFDLKGCPWLVQLPQGFGNLKRLVELDTHNCVSLTRMPGGISELTSLFRLSGYHANDESGSVLVELQSLVNIRELRLEKLEQVWRSEVGDLMLQKKANLKYLTLHWQWWNVDLDFETKVYLEASSQQELEPLDFNLSEAEIGVHHQISIEQHVRQLEDLQPYQPSLEKLEIISYMGNKWPSWMLDASLFNCFTEIILINVKRCGRLPPLEQLSDLQIIEISGMDLITTVDVAYEQNKLSDLKQLTLSEMPKLEKLLLRSHYIIGLRELKIIHCPKLRILDLHNFECDKLKIWLHNEMMFASEFRNNLVILEELEIVGCQELKFLPEGMKNLNQLKKLTIISCSNLISLPEWMGEEDFPKFESLKICNCPVLISIPAILRRLKQITIEGCPKLQLPRNLRSHIGLRIIK